MEANTPDTAPKIISNANNKRPFLKGNNKPPKMGPRKKARLPPIVTKAKYVVFKWTGAILAFKACIFGNSITSTNEIKNRQYLTGHNKQPKNGQRKKSRLPPIVKKTKYVVFKWTGAILAFKACIFGTPITSPKEIKIAAERNMNVHPENVNTNKPMT